jgi:2-octaprenyl-6-methoxyphenol hydroxylase
MSRIDTDILVAGGGIAGMATSAVFARSGFTVTCVDPAPASAADPASPDPAADLRSTAFLEPAIDLLDQAGVWPVLASFCTDLATMRICDCDATGRIRQSADFAAAEVGLTRFGVNVPNEAIRSALREHLASLPGLRLVQGASLTGYLPRLNGAIATLSDGRRIDARLTIAADGRDSFVRRTLEIGTRTWRYGQKALVFAVAHELPHGNVSTEIHRSGGPFTLVPLPDRDGQSQSAVVWMETGPKAAALMAMPPDDFDAALNDRSAGVLGTLRLTGERALWPIISQIADRLDGPRAALVAEAAHVMPPIGAQGLNTSLGDIRALRDLAADARDRGADFGAPGTLARYNRARHAATLARVIGIDALNRASMTGAPPLTALRAAGIRALASIAPLKQAAMRAGLASGPGLPNAREHGLARTA